MNRRPNGGESDRPPPAPLEPSEPHFVVSPHPFGLKKVVKVAFAVLGTGLTFVAATATGLLLHLGSPPARRLASAAVNGILSGTFRGKLDVVRLAGLQSDGLDGGAITLTDPEGERVALLEGVHARIALFPLLASLLSHGDMKIRVTELSIDHIDALLKQTADGTLTIAESFQPAVAGPPPPPEKGAAGLDLSLSKITLKHAWVHGEMSALPLIDGDIDDVAGSFGMTPAQTSVALERLTVRTRSMPKNGDIGAELDGRLVLPAAGDRISGAVALRGTVGGIDLAVQGAIDGKQVDAAIDLPRVAPAQLERILGESPIHAPASAHIEAHGALPHLAPTVHLTVGKGTVDVSGKVTIPSDGQTDTFAELTVAARDLDARVASPASAASKLGLDASASARISADGAADGTYEVHVLPGAYGAQPTPDARIAGTFKPTSVRGTAHISEPGVPSDVRFDLNPVAKGGPDLSFDAAIRANDLASVPQLGHSVRGRAIVHAFGNVALGTKRVAAHVESSLDDVARGSNGVEHAELRVAVEGALAAPHATVTIAGNGLRVAKYSYPLFSAKLDGTPRRAHVTADLSGGKDAHIVADADVSAVDGLTARDVLVTAARDKDTVRARVASVQSRGGNLDVEGIRVEGAGDPLEGDVHLRAGSLAARLVAADVNVPTLLRVAGIQTALRDGHVGLDVDVKASKRATSGHVNATLDRVTYGDAVRGLDAKLAATFDGRNATLHLDARDGSKNALALDTENAHLAAGALDPRAWKEATGRVHANVDVNLDRVRKEGGAAVPLEELRGRLTAKIDVERDQAARRPSVILDAATQGLSLTTEPAKVDNGDKTVTVVGRALHSEGLDGHVKASLDGETGAAAFDALLRDRIGQLAEVNASTTLPMKAILGGGDVRDSLLGTKVRAHVQIPIRSVGDVPALIGSIPVRGEVGLTLDVEGTAREPHVQALLHGRNITDADDPTPVPVGFDLAAIYDGDALRAKIVGTQKTATVLDVDTTVALRVKDVLAGAFNWEANANAKITKFPIGAITGFFDENLIDGDLSGTIALHDLHKAGALDVDLDLQQIEINGSKFGDTTAQVTVRDGSLKADAEVAQLDGSADVHVEAGMGWGDAIAPAFDEKAPIDVALHAKNFRVGMLAPFVREAVSELDGRLNADTKLHVLPGLKDGSMNGAIVLDRGLFETPALGEEFHNLKARIFMKPWGLWNVQEVSADGTSGHFTASASAKMNGLHFQSGEAHLGIAEKEKLPLAMQGMALGTVWGKVDTKAALARDGKTIDIDVNVPDLHVLLPQSIAHGVQSTDPDPSIKVGAIEPTGVVAILPVDGSLPPPKPADSKSKTPSAPPVNLHIVTHLGPDLEIRRDTMLRAYVTEGPTIDIGKETKISGQLAIPRGYIELQGKRFQIEKGEVKFTGQPADDPIVLADAVYEAQDGTKVFADFIGPVKTGKLTLRSEPALSQNEILALLLFGTSDGTFGESAPPGGNDGTQAASLAGGVVTQGLNKAISGVSGVEVQTKVDTQDSGDPRPEVEVALSRDVSATVIYNLGVPPPGQNPDDTLLVVDWRFHKNYSTEATLGDKGTSILDLTWKYRY